MCSLTVKTDVRQRVEKLMMLRKTLFKFHGFKNELNEHKLYTTAVKIQDFGIRYN